MGEKVKSIEEVLASSFHPPQNGLGADHGDALTERANNGVGMETDKVMLTAQLKTHKRG